LFDKLFFYPPELKTMEVSMQSNVLITDIGSTTTKAVLFQQTGSGYTLRGSCDMPTTVEKPWEDVRHGVFNSIQGLQTKTGVDLMAAESTPQHLLFAGDVLYLSTSSAGGGLQILVVGLTVFDSAASAQRVAFGAGGVLLDTFAIDDSRSAVEQMQDMQCLQPDIVLFTGGIDGGAISGLIRLGEILSMARPAPKYGENRKIPLVFAGNKDAVSFIESLFKGLFELYIVPNVRPTMTEENPAPARDEIRRLFMDNVMERAPGYAGLKPLTGSPIIPTPFGVMKALTLLSEKSGRSLLAVDIGGATTDVFSNILGKMYRTVSASLGMSYNLGEVFAQSGWDHVREYLPAHFNEDTVRNYTGNKVLNPTVTPATDQAQAIEHALAREALRLAKEEHLRMNFNTERTGYLDRVKASMRDMSAKLLDTFYVEQSVEARRFTMREFELLIGAGGTISHAPLPEQAAMVLIDGLAPLGLTELWRDRHFISPHLGKLSELDADTAYTLLQNEAFERLGWHVKPLFSTSRKPRVGIRIEIAGEPEIAVSTGEFRYVPNPGNRLRKIIIHLEHGFFLQDNHPEATLETDLPLFVDLRESADFEQVNRVLKIATFDTPPTQPARKLMQSEAGILHREIRLPYQGEIKVLREQSVQPDTIVGVNPFDPPRIFVLSLFTATGMTIDEVNLRKGLLIHHGEEVRAGQMILDSRKMDSKFDGCSFASPVRGRVEEINYPAGIVVLREMQDYSDKPVHLNVAEHLGLPPRKIRSYLTKYPGEYVYAGDALAKRLLDSGTGGKPTVIQAPSTGTITDINYETGIVTIQYKHTPHTRLSLVPGTVESVEDGFAATIAFTGTTVEGCIGFGTEAGGVLHVERDSSGMPGNDSIIVVPRTVTRDNLDAFAKAGVRGVVAASADEAEIVEYLGYEIGIAITGKEKIPFPIVLTEGFGTMTMPPDTLDFFTRAEGRRVFIEGRTQIRAGVVRPRIVIIGE
jgi:uncharacterized protein (TIGR01319 family)